MSAANLNATDAEKEERLNEILRIQRALSSHGALNNGNGAAAAATTATTTASSMLAAMSNILNGNGATAAVKRNGKLSKKIIDHSEYMNLDFKFSNTQLKDPLIKELHRLMQSKETLVQFRKLQADLNRITGGGSASGSDLK